MAMWFNSSIHRGAYRLSGYQKRGGRTHHGGKKELPSTSELSGCSSATSDFKTATNITVEQCSIPNVIVGTVDLMRRKEKSYYALCIELKGKITIGSASIVLFPINPSPEGEGGGGAEVYTSGIHCLMSGEPEGMLLHPPTSIQPDKQLRSGFNQFSFILTLPDQAVPASIHDDHLKIEYELELYIRTRKQKYKLLGNKELRFYGHLALPKEGEGSSGNPLIKTFPVTSTSGLIKYIQTEKSKYLKGEGIPFLIQLQNLPPSPNLLAAVTVNLLKEVWAGGKMTEEKVLETITVTRQTQTGNTPSIRGEFNKSGEKVKIPTYHLKDEKKKEGDAVSIAYYIQCEVTCGSSTTVEKVEVTIGTNRGENNEGVGADHVIQWNEDTRQWEPVPVGALD